jgi:hypothetical protein
MENNHAIQFGKTSISMGHFPGKLRSALPLHPHCIFRPHLGAHEVRETFQGSVLLHDLAAIPGIPGAQPRWDGTGITWYIVIRNGTGISL